MSTKKLTRKEKGLCGSCNNPPRKGMTLCQACADKRREKMREKRRGGHCTVTGCWNIPVGGAVRCRECVVKRSEYDKATRKKRLASGVCSQCGGKREDNRAQCSRCRAIHLKSTLRRNFSGNRDAVIERDKNLCQLCNRFGKAVHHIDGTGINSGKKTNNSIDNLVVLCRKCHTDIHILGKHRLSASQLISWPSASHALKLTTQQLAGWKRVRATVMTRDKGKCVVCTSQSKRMVVHHRDDRGALYAEPNNELSNLVVLCSTCHNAVTHLRNNADRKKAALFIMRLGSGTVGTPVAS